MAELKEGFYWVKFEGQWDIAKFEPNFEDNNWYVSKDPWAKKSSEFEEIGMYLDTKPKHHQLREDWNKVVNENINVPDDLDPLINKLGFQLRFHTISGKGEVETLCSMARIAEEFFHKKYKQE